MPLWAGVLSKFSDMPEFLDDFARYVSSFMDSCVALAALRAAAYVAADVG